MSIIELTKDEIFRNKIKAISNLQLSEMAHKALSNLCANGGNSFRMTVPPRIDDTDIILSEVITRFELATIEATSQPVQVEEAAKSKEKILSERIAVHRPKWMSSIPYVFYDAIYEAMEQYATQFAGANSGSHGKVDWDAIEIELPYKVKALPVYLIPRIIEFFKSKIK